MSILFWLGCFLKSRRLHFLRMGVVMRLLLRMQLFCHRQLIRCSHQCTICRQCTTLVSFKFVFVFPDSCFCCQSASSVCVSPRQQWRSHWALWAVQQVQAFSRKKRSKQPRAHILNSHDNPALRHNRDFNIATAQRPRDAMQVFIQIHEICSCDTGLCSLWKCVEY